MLLDKCVVYVILIWITRQLLREGIRQVKCDLFTTPEDYLIQMFQLTLD